MPRSLEALIDECAALCQGQNKLAARIGSTPGRVSDWKRGIVPIPAPMLAKLCDLAQLDGAEARELLAWCEIQNPKNETTREVMRRAFFGQYLAGAVAFLILGGISFPEVSAGTDLPVYTLCAMGLILFLVQYTAASGCVRLRRLRPSR